MQLAAGICHAPDVFKAWRVIFPHIGTVKANFASSRTLEVRCVSENLPLEPNLRKNSSATDRKGNKWIRGEIFLRLNMNAEGSRRLRKEF